MQEYQSLAVRITPPLVKGKWIPIQSEFKKLAREPLFQKISTTDSSSTSWIIARIGALFGSIYNSRITTLEDRVKISVLSQEVSKLEATHKSRSDLTIEERTFNDKCFSLANKALSEMTLLCSTLNKSYPVQDVWEKAIHSLGDSTYSPLFPGEPLLATEHIEKAIWASRKLQKQIDRLPEGSAARSSLEQTRDELSASFMDTLEDWGEITLAAMKEEWQELYNNLDPDNGDTLREFLSLCRQEQILYESLIGLSQHQPYLKNIASEIREEQHRMIALADPEFDYYTPLPELVYGSPEWMVLAAKRPLKSFSLFDKIKQALTFDPESWGETKKAVVHALLVGMQLSEHVIQAQAKIDQAIALNEVAARLKENHGALREYQNLHDRQKPTDRDEKKPAARLKESHGALCEYQSLHDRQKPTVRDEKKPSVSLFDQEVTLVTSPGARPTSWVNHLVNFVGSIFSPKEPTSAQVFISTKTAAGQKELRKSISTLKKLSESPEEITRQLSREIALLQREILKTLQDQPDDTCPLQVLAHWTQEVSDKCYAVASLEERITYLMSLTRKTLLGNDRALENYGKKHANIARLLSLVKGLNLPGLEVPVPHGITSNHVKQFLQKYVPSIFTHWEALNREYSQHEGDRSYLDRPEAKAHLLAIENGIKEAFRRAGEDESIFNELVSKELSDWLYFIKKLGDYLMLRSTGAEDSKQTANAGGNKSPAYVAPTREAFCEAAGEVVISYFGFGSLQNRIIAGINPFANELKLAVTSQQLIGEPIGGTKTENDIPISLVLFTSEPLYVGEEKFRVMRISATRGHGEGVVGGLGIGTDTALLLISVTNPDRLYILYDNADKPERLAPIRTPRGVELQPISNPERVRNHPVLNEDLLTRLYTLGVVTEKFFDNYPTDMEIVIRNGIIYPVQARPINRPRLLPTYIDMKKVVSLPKSPIIESMQGELLVPGRGSVVNITDPEKVNFASTLKDAEDASHKKHYDVVIVKKPEPANSHPVVNFSGLGMPCLVVTNEKQIRKLIKQASPAHPLLIDMQTGAIILWDSALGNPNSCINEGFAVHPAKIAISLPIPIQIGHRVATQPPQEIKNLLLAIGTAGTKKEALNYLQLLRNHTFVTSLKREIAQLNNYEIPISKLKEIRHVLKLLDKKIDEAFTQVEDSLQQAPHHVRLQPLFQLKVLGSLLIDKAESRASLSQYSRFSVQTLFHEALALIDYQNSLTHQAYFADLVFVGSHSLTPKAQIQWVTFLKDLEPLAHFGKISKRQVGQLRKMIRTFEKMEMLSTWVTLFFPEISRSHLPPSEKFLKVLETFPPQEEAFLEYFISLNQVLQMSQSKIELFSSPETFEKGWDWLLNQNEKVKSGAKIDAGNTLSKQLATCSPVSKMVARKVMQEFVDIFDLSIKTMKSSPKWTREEKVKLFKKMLSPYFELLLDWGGNLETGSIIMHSNWDLPKYLQEMRTIFDRFSENNPIHLEASAGFSVVAAMIGARTAFERHFPRHMEDFFTLIHQNCKRLTSEGTDLSEAAFPDLFKEILLGMQPTNFGQEIQISSVEITESAVTIKYNIPLRNHSAQMWILFDKLSGETFLKGFLLGEARNRWDASKTLLLYLDAAGLVPLSEPIHLTAQEMSFSWKINDMNSFGIAVNEWKYLLEMSFQGSLSNHLLENIMTKYQLPIEPLAETIISKLAESDPISHIHELHMYTFFANHSIRLDAAMTSLLKKGERESVDTRMARLDLLKVLLKKGYPINVATSVALIEYLDSRALAFFKDLFTHGLGFNEAISIAGKQLLSSDESDRDNSLELYTSLFKIQQGFEAASTAISIGILSPEKNIRQTHIKLFEILYKYAQDYPGVIAAANVGTMHANSEVRETCHYLLQLMRVLQDESIDDLFKNTLTNLEERNFGDVLEKVGIEIKEQGAIIKYNVILKNHTFQMWLHYDKYSRKASLIRVNEILATASACILDESSDSNDRNACLKIFQDIIENGEGFEAALAFASIGVQSQDTYVQDASNRLFISLFDKGQGFQEATVLASKGIVDPDWIINQNYRTLFYILLRYRQGLEATSSVANDLLMDPSPYIRSFGLTILDMAVEGGLAFEEGAQAVVRGIMDENKSVCDASISLFKALLRQEKGHLVFTADPTAYAKLAQSYTQAT